MTLKLTDEQEERRRVKIHLEKLLKAVLKTPGIWGLEAFGPRDLCEVEPALLRRSRPPPPNNTTLSQLLLQVSIVQPS